MNSTANIEQLLKNGKIKLIDINVLRTLLSVQREDVRKKICSAKDARYILDMSEKAFYKLIAEKDCLIRPSSKKGKYVLSSVYDEAKRLNNL